MSTKKNNWLGLLIIVLTLVSPIIVDKLVDKMFEGGER
jgi:hypothetical protein